MESTASHVLKDGMDLNANDPVLTIVSLVECVTKEMGFVNVRLQICHKRFYIIIPKTHFYYHGGVCWLNCPQRGKVLVRDASFIHSFNSKIQLHYDFDI